MKVDLTPEEFFHILYLLEVNEREGWYCGNYEQYWKGHERIKAKLSSPNNPKQLTTEKVKDV